MKILEAVDRGSGSDVPIIKMDNAGKVSSAHILEAVPVIIVGRTGAGIKTNTKKGLSMDKTGQIFLRGVGRNRIVDVEDEGIVTANDLSEEDYEIYKYILDLDDRYNIATDYPHSHPKSLTGLRYYMEDHFALKGSRFKTFLDLEKRINGDSPRLEKAVYAFVYALGKKKTKLALFIRREHKIHGNGKKLFVRNILSKGIRYLFGVVKNIIAIPGKILNKTLGSILALRRESLSDNDKLVYDTINAYGYDALISEIKDKFRARKIIDIINKIKANNSDSIEEDLLIYMKALVAGLWKNNQVWRVFKHEWKKHGKLILNVLDNNKDKKFIEKTINNGDSIIGLLKTGGKLLTSIFKRSSISTGSTPSSARTDTTVEDSSADLAIPKIKIHFTIGSGDNIKSYDEAVPVYVIGGNYFRMFSPSIESPLEASGKITERQKKARKEMYRMLGKAKTKFGEGGQAFKEGTTSGAFSYRNDAEKMTMVSLGTKYKDKPLGEVPVSLMLPGGLNIRSSIVGTDKIPGILKMPAMPSYIINNELDDISANVLAINSNIGLKLDQILLGMSNFVLAAPMGVGTMMSPTALALGTTGTITSAVMDTLKTGLDGMMSTLGMNTGGTVAFKNVPKFASGGSNSIITGDAPGGNIFANGAKPELVRSNGNLTVTPLNKTGTETKVTRMTAAERREALATAIASHSVRVSFKLPDGVEELSSPGEAIKVYNIKPGISDPISVNGETTTVADILAGIYTQLALLTGNTATGNELLSAIASKPAAIVNNNSQPQSNNNFPSSFPNNLDSILGGD